QVQTDRKIIKDAGVLHKEGGWPKEIHPRDGETVYRFRRRVEKDASYVSTMRNLLPLMENNVCQNNAVNIHQNFFDDMIPTPLVKQYDMRIWNSYQDPQEIVRPIRSLSWSPNGSNRLAAAYAFTEFEEHSTDVNPYSYVWDVGNAIQPMIALKSSSPMLAVKFNPRDLSMLISGHMSGQVCCWDIRMGGTPVHTSHIFLSHGAPATRALWTSSKANTEFFSASSNGTIMWWDTRFMKRPTHILVMDMYDPRRMDRFKAIGVTALNFEPTMSNKFLVGLVNGMAINVNRKNVTPEEQFAMKFECYTGPVHSLDRNPFAPKSFLTIGDWSAKVWSDDTREGSLLSTREQDVCLTGGCWSKSRGSIFFTINKKGLLEAYDILAGMRKPLTSIQVYSGKLTAISTHDEGDLLAVGGANGTIYVLECLEGLTAFSREDKMFLNNYLDGCNRFEKVLDNRLKEIRLHYNTIELEKDEPKSKTRIKKKDTAKEKKKVANATQKEKVEKKKLKKPRMRRKESFTIESELMAAQKLYFQLVEEQMAKIEDIDPEDTLAAQSLLNLRVVTKPDDVEVESEQEDPKRERSQRSTKFRRRTTRKKGASKIYESDLAIEPIMEADQGSQKGKGTRRRSFLKSCPMEVCKPDICCKDVIGKRSSKRKKKTIHSDEPRSATQIGSFVLKSISYVSLGDYLDQILPLSREDKMRILRQKNFPPNFLREELAKAKLAVRTWQDQILAGKLSFRTVLTKMGKVPDESEMVDRGELKEQMESKASLVEQSDDQKSVPLIVRKSGHRRITRRKKVISVEEEEELAKVKRRESLRKLMVQMKEFEDKMRPKWSYPRISAARRYSEH
ncbi:Dynein intermediate chain 3, ciliary, partial [Dufourea novaeangliae]